MTAWLAYYALALALGALWYLILVPWAERKRTVHRGIYPILGMLDNAAQVELKLDLRRREPGLRRRLEYGIAWLIGAAFRPTKWTVVALYVPLFFAGIVLILVVGRLTAVADFLFRTDLNPAFDNRVRRLLGFKPREECMLSAPT